KGAARKRKWQLPDLGIGPVLRCPREVKPGTEILAMAEQYPALGLFTGAQDRLHHLLHELGAQSASLVRPVQSDQRDLSAQFICDEIITVHLSSPIRPRARQARHMSV